MRQDRFLMGILAGIGVLVVLAVALFFVRRGTLAYGPEDTPAGVTRNFVVAIKQGDYARAYGYLSDTVAAKPDELTFQQTFQQMQSSEIASTGVEVGSETINGERAFVAVTLLRGSGGLFGDIYRDQQSAELVREGEAWKLKTMPYPFWGYAWIEPIKAEPVQ